MLYGSRSGFRKFETKIANIFYKAQFLKLLFHKFMNYVPSLGLNSKYWAKLTYIMFQESWIGHPNDRIEAYIRTVLTVVYG